MANLVLKDVSKVYPSGAVALCKVDLELSDREFVAVIGGEKSGKSTLLRVVAGLEEVTSGTVTIGGKDVTALQPKDRDVAMIFRNDTLYPSLNVYDNMAYGLRLRKAPPVAVDARVKAAAEMLGLSDVLGRKPKTLTAGQRRRVALGRAVAREPKLYLLDDPVAGLDDSLKAQMRSLIVNVQARMEGTFLYATRNVGEALSMATRVIVLREGVVQQIDTPANLYDYPANAYVALLVGSPDINLVGGAVIEEREGGLVALCKGVEIPIAENIAQRLTAKEEYVGTGREVIIGIRPEDIKWGEGMPAEVIYTDPADGKNYAECKVSDNLSLLTLVPDDVQKGMSGAVSPDGGRLYIFDGATRINILARDDGYTQTGLAGVEPRPYDEEEALKASLRPAPEVKAKKRR